MWSLLLATELVAQRSEVPGLRTHSSGRLTSKLVYFTLESITEEEEGKERHCGQQDC